jgi:hypothetical protein
MRPHSGAPLREVDAAALKHDVQNVEGMSDAGGRVRVRLGLEDVYRRDDVGMAQPPQDGDFAQDAPRVGQRFKYIRDPLDDDGSVSAVAVNAPAQPPPTYSVMPNLRVTFHVEGESIPDTSYRPRASSIGAIDIVTDIFFEGRTSLPDEFIINDIFFK